MKIQSASAYSAMSRLNGASRQPPVSAIAASHIAATATFAETVAISQAARDRLAATSGATADFDTDQGVVNMNIDTYFTPPSGGYLTLPPLLLPSQKNIDALSRHVSAAMPRFLAENRIPFPPASITYDNAGKVELPADYPYATEFKQALERNTTLARELSTINALTSHVVEMKKSMPFQQEYAAATTQAEIDAVIAKYRYLFSDNRHYDTIALHFSPSGELTLTADGKPLS